MEMTGQILRLSTTTPPPPMKEPLVSFEQEAGRKVSLNASAKTRNPVTAKIQILLQRKKEMH
jgi:hypothetical protein